MLDQNNMSLSGESRQRSGGWAGGSERLAPGRQDAAVVFAGVSLGRVSAGSHGSAGPGLTRLRVVAIRRVVAVRVPALLAAAVIGVALWHGLVGNGSVVSRVVPPVAAHPGARVHDGLSSLPLAAQGAVSEALGRETGAYRVSRPGAWYQAVNPAQGLQARFDRAGVRVQSAGVRLALRLGAVGYGGSLVAVAPVTPRARGNRVVYAHAGVSEWYANGPLGLEQGFTLAHAPVGDARGPLTVSLALSGNARARLDPGRQGLTLAAQGSSLRYDSLMTTDARGRVLHSWITLHGGLVLLHVDAHGARYPLSIDPLVQQGPTLHGSPEESGEGWFGFSVALSSDGNTALIGGPTDNKLAGAAWVFTRSSGIWTQQGKKITGLEEKGEGEFGTVVALSSNGNTALIGGPTDNKLAGAAWVFTRSTGIWTQQGKKITGLEENGEGEFGYGVALSSDGNTALIGGPSDNKKEGAAWVFTRSSGIWTQQGKKITGLEENGEGRFGWKVALASEGNTALIAGPSDNKDVGAVWVFTRSEGKWTQQGKKITGLEENGEGWFGYSVALSLEGNIALIGGPGDNKYVGAAWVFARSEGKWTQQGSKLTGEGEIGAGYFGYGVALSSEGNTALIGAPYSNSEAGAAWVFTRSEEGGWLGEEMPEGKEELYEGQFGFRVALSSEGSTALLGGYREGKGEGAAWVFASGPIATTGLATGVSETEVTLHAKVNPNGEATEYYFEYGATESYGSKTAAENLSWGTSSVEVSSVIAGLLKADTTYYYRIVATNGNGTTDGTTQSFTTTYWSSQEPPGPGAKANYLAGVSCTSSTACIAVGVLLNSSEKAMSLAERWNGTTWSAQEPPDPTSAKEGYLSGVSCTSSTACIAVGGFVNSSGSDLPLGEKWNGTTWSAQEPPLPTGARGGGLSGVSCTSSIECVAVGDFTSSSGKPLTLADRWNGTTWSAQEPPLPTGAKEGYLASVSCTSSIECVAVGRFVNSSGGMPLGEKWNGATWSSQEPPEPTGGKENFLMGVSCTSSTACIAVGEFVNSSGKPVPLGEKWNGTKWSAQEPPVPTEAAGSDLASVSCTASTECIATGFFNSPETFLPLADRWNGTTWSLQEPPLPTGAHSGLLSGVSCMSSTECVAGGEFYMRLGETTYARVPLVERML
jgi:hypothetical protein